MNSAYSLLIWDSTRNVAVNINKIKNCKEPQAKAKLDRQDLNIGRAIAQPCPCSFPNSTSFIGCYF